tara:strand:- start:712 stop:849 length:138 start_codon:yes stop_codon:yes gene_type:complete
MQYFLPQPGSLAWRGGSSSSFAEGVHFPSKKKDERHNSREAATHQ